MAPAQKYATNAGRCLRVARRKLRADGTATPAGAFSCEDLLNLERPKLYAYESPRIDGKWVQAFGGSRVLVRRKRGDGSWKVTKQGEQYFRRAAPNDVQAHAGLPRGAAPDELAWLGGVHQPLQDALREVGVERLGRHPAEALAR
jgi:hypothetical protein